MSGVSRQPSVAQWARAQAMRSLTTVLGGSRVVVTAHDAHVMEKNIDRWAHYIETGRWEISS